MFENASGAIDGDDTKEQAIKELKEETGIEIDAKDVVFVGQRQIAATLCLHKSYTYAAKISAEQLCSLDTQKCFGNLGDSEKTYICIKSIDEIVKEENVDWANLGMIFAAINKL